MGEIWCAAVVIGSVDGKYTLHLGSAATDHGALGVILEAMRDGDVVVTKLTHQIWPIAPIEAGTDETPKSGSARRAKAGKAPRDKS